MLFFLEPLRLFFCRIVPLLFSLPALLPLYHSYESSCGLEDIKDGGSIPYDHGLYVGTGLSYCSGKGCVFFMHVTHAVRSTGQVAAPEWRGCL